MTPLRLDKRERIILLLKSRSDALNETPEQQGRGQFSSRSLQHGDLWHEGSYRELERLLDEMRAVARGIHWHTIHFYIPTKGWRSGLKPRKRPAELGVNWLERRMTNVYVPASISENAGFLPSEAAKYAKPRSMRAAA